MAYMMEEGKYDFTEKEDQQDVDEAKGWADDMNQFNFASILIVRYILNADIISKLNK